MIKYALKCGGGHAFDAWFRSSEDCDRQLLGRLVSCPQCGQDTIEKSIMAPRLAQGRSAEPTPAPEPPTPAPPTATTPIAMKRAVEAKLRALRSYVEANAEHVGPRFAEEARRIHDGESEERAIYGEASPEEVETLVDDGVPCAPLPWIDRRDD